MAYKKKKDLIFPEDCVVEILLKLPIKSILRFRSVSKYWYALSTSSYFINTHIKLNERKEFLFLDTNKDKILSFNLEDESIVNILNSRLEICRLVGSCNGIICFMSDDYNIILLNPSMREFKVVPLFRRLPKVNDRISSIGFGFDDLNNDYKVILILYPFDMIRAVENRIGPYIYEAAIYSSRSNTWRKLEDKNINILFTPSQFIKPDYSSLFFNGSIHWNAHHFYIDFDVVTHIRLTIFSMDISSETLYEFQYPEAILLRHDSGGLYYQSCIQIIRDSLSIIFMYKFDMEGEEYIDIWSMKEYGITETWSKQYSIGHFYSFVNAVSISENKDEEDHLLLQINDKYQSDCELVKWNLLKNKEIKRYYIKGIFIDIETLCYSQSLVSIDKNKLDYT